MYALPTWDRWVDLQARRTEARPLWERLEEATRREQDATAALLGHLASFPAHLRDPAEVTRQLGALRDAAAREHAAREQAARQSGRAALVTVLQVRAEALERTRLHEARVRHEAARRAAARREQERREAQRRRAQQDRLARTRETQLALLDVLSGRLTQLQRAARQADTDSVCFVDRSEHHRSVNSTSGTRFSPARSARIERLCQPFNRSPYEIAAPEQPDQPAPGAVLTQSDLAAARNLLVRHAAVAAQAAMCLEALEDWAGPGVTGEEALRLAEQVSRTPPTDPAQPQLPVALEPPAGVPVTAGHWHHLWAGRERGAALRGRWLEARAALTALEEQMAPLWAAWPAGTRHVAALREVTEAAARHAPDTTPAAPVSARPDADPALPALLPVPPPAPARVDRSGPWTAPHLTPEQRPAARTLLDRFDALRERERRTLDDLASWAGPGLDGLRLAALVSGPLPGELTLALAAWARTRGNPVAHASPEQAQVAAAVQAEKDRSASVLGPLRLLQPHAAAVIQAEHALAGTRPSAVQRAQRRLLDARDTYAVQAAALGFTPAPSPRRIATLIEDELAAFNRRLQPLDAQWKALVGRVEAPPEQPGSWERAWADLSARYGLPPHPDTWERNVWPRRAGAERLWTELQGLRQELQAAQEDLTVLCATWPAGARTVDTLRQVAAHTGGSTPPVVTPLAFPDQTRPTQTQPTQTRPTQTRPTQVPPAQPFAASTRPGPATDPVPGPDAPLPVPPPVQPIPVRPAPVARPSVQSLPVPGVPVQNVAAPSPALRPAPLPPVAPDMQTGPVVSPPVPPAARETLPLTTPALSLPSPVSPAPVRPPPVTPSPVTPSPMTLPPMPTTPPPRPLAGPGPSQPVVRPAPLLPPVRGVPLPPVPVTRPSTPEPGEPLPEPATGRLTRRQRAEREAVRISDRYDWEQGFHLIADALDRDRWGQLRESIEREIARGMTPDEFELLLQLRAYWHDQTHYQSPYTARYDSLPWELGIALIRRCAGVPCLDDMILLLERFYEYAQVACSPRSLPAFSQRLGAILDRAEPDVDLDYWLSTREGR
ncbi:hypothetical protein [Deinococcus sp. JMULE3]|uniref:hypothetical protein n=1 Tax=Deinococcus sp. JMULE3 TaxID=2518341 RepID=UPI001577270D|nr:hypothetical protein [Deinococcus sp. JMULE3]